MLFPVDKLSVIHLKSVFRDIWKFSFLKRNPVGFEFSSTVLCVIEPSVSYTFQLKFEEKD